MNAIALFMKPWKSLTLPQAVEKAHAFGVNARTPRLLAHA
jgi:hypothetical protein